MVKVHLYQIVIVAISSVMIFLGIKEFVKREAGQTLLKLVVRLIVWGGMALVAIYPDSTYYFARVIRKTNKNPVTITAVMLSSIPITLAK